MKYTLGFLIGVLLFNCSPDRPDQNATGDPEISFDVNGKHYSYKGQSTSSVLPGVFAYKKSPDFISSETYYSFYGTKDNFNYMVLVIETDSLKTISYSNTLAAGFRLAIDDEYYSSIDRRPTITISKYENGIVNGTFSGVALSDKNPQLNIPPITITNGVIKNVKINYQ